MGGPVISGGRGIRRRGTPSGTAVPTIERVITHPESEVIDCEELARRWNLPPSWIREQTRNRATDPIPHLRFGRYVRFQWGTPDLAAWLERRRSRKI
jgi:hypothetical protein